MNITMEIFSDDPPKPYVELDMKISKPEELLPHARVAK